MVVFKNKAGVEVINLIIFVMLCIAGRDYLVFINCYRSLPDYHALLIEMETLFYNLS